MNYTIQANAKGSRSIQVNNEHLATIQTNALFADLLDSNGIVDESVVEKLRLNVRALLESKPKDEALLRLCQEVLFHDNMKAFGLHQLITFYLMWEEKQSAEEAENA